MIRTVNIKNLGAHVKNLTKQRYQDGVKSVRTCIHQRARDVVRQATNETSPRVPFDRGEYLRSWRVIDIPNGVRLFSTSLYASVIERGRRPGTWPPIGPLIGWVHRHNMVDQSKLGAEGQMRWARAAKTTLEFLARSKVKARKFTSEARSRQERSIAFAIAAAIYKRGLPAKLVLERASVRIIAMVEVAFAQAIVGVEVRV